MLMLSYCHNSALLRSIPFIFQNYTREGCLRLDDEAVRIAVSVRLGMAIRMPHCHCGSLVDAHDLHSFVCRKAPGKIRRLNDLVARAFTSAGSRVLRNDTV